MTLLVPLWKIANTSESCLILNRRRIFIDRDGKHFRHILNYLRDGSVPALNPPDQAQLIIEAGYYKLPDLVVKLQAKLTGSGLGGRSRKATKRRRRRYK